VVARGSDYVFGQDLSDVARFVGLDYSATPELSPQELVERLECMLLAALRFGSQIPADRLGDKLPNRDRTYLALLNHIFEIAAGLLKITGGASMTGEIAAAVPDLDRDLAALTMRSNEIIEGLDVWWGVREDPECARNVDTFYGTQSLHAVLERITWHCAQHVRQLMMVLEMLHIPADDPLGAQDFERLPMPKDVWDG